MRAPVVGRMVVLLALLGCGGSSQDTGAPQLVSWLAQVPNTPDVDLLAPPDGGAPAVSGVAQFKLVFNKLLDGDKIEAITDAGLPQAKTDVISITWMNAPAGAAAIVGNTNYDPSGALSVTTPGPKIVLAPSPGLPSGAMLLFKLDRTKITGKTGTPFAGSDMQIVSTLPFDVSSDVMAGQPLAPDGAVHLAFTNVPAMNVADHIKATAGGAPVALELMPDQSDPRNLVVSSKSWLPGQTLMLTIDKGAADLFGVTLTADVVIQVAIAAGDGGAAGADAAVGDGGAADAAATPDGGAPADANAADAGAPVDAVDAAAGDAAPSDAGGDDITTGG